MDNSKKEFERYLRREMSDEERHLFEKAMLDNPFEYEAMEGMEEFETEHIIEDLDSLDKLITAKQKNETKPKLMIYREAAVILLLATFGILTYFFSLKEQGEELLSENTQIEDNSKTSIDTNALSLVVPEKVEDKQAEAIEPIEPKSTEALTQTKPQPEAQQPEKVIKGEEVIATVEEEPTDDFVEEVETIETLADNGGAGARVLADEAEEINDTEAAPKAFSAARAKRSSAPVSAAPSVALESTIDPSYSVSFPDGIEENKLQPKNINSFIEAFNQNYAGPKLPAYLEVKLFSNAKGDIVELKSITEIDEEIIAELQKLFVGNEDWRPTIKNGVMVEDSVRLIIE